jgi:methylmalonyl-CoA mutase
VHRDAEAFEALRTRLERAPRTVTLMVLGPPAEHRARAAYATAFFATAGLRAVERAVPGSPAPADLACLCGSDERYAAEAVALAGELRAAGCTRIALAGRPGALEPALRAAGIDTFIFIGCDVVATLTELTASQAASQAGADV